jgi:hypothetical protein
MHVRGAVKMSGQKQQKILPPRKVTVFFGQLLQ